MVNKVIYGMLVARTESSTGRICVLKAAFSFVCHTQVIAAAGGQKEACTATSLHNRIPLCDDPIRSRADPIWPSLAGVTRHMRMSS